jgi:rSAM/selenodomain-associated transferase 2
MKLDISVIIPALNAASFLPGTLAALGEVSEIIVVDGGSVDATCAQAVAYGARVLSSRRGRGVQLATGIAAASSPWLLLLHADTRLSAGWGNSVDITPRQAGYFRFVLDAANPRARRLERMVAWRSRALGLPYGDQGLLLHRDLLRAVGGMKSIPLMEDVDLVRRLGRSRLHPLPADAITSARKWEAEGYIRRSSRNLLCLSLWFAGVTPERILRLYE